MERRVDKSTAANARFSELYHDFNDESPRRMRVAAVYVDYRSKLSKIYAFLVFIMFCYGLVMSVVAICRLDNKMVAAEAVHWGLVSLDMAGAVFTRYKVPLDEPLATIKRGFFRYHDALQTESYDEFKKEHVKRVRSLSGFYLRFIICVIPCQAVIPFLNNKNLNDNDMNVVNEIMPVVMYTPFDTSEPVGFYIGYSINVLLLFYLGCTCTAAIEVLVSLTEQLFAQFDILNMSIVNVEKRALSNFLRDNSEEGVPPSEELYRLPGYQQCLYRCLRENALHHQILLRFIDQIKSYIQVMHFFAFISTALLIALFLFILLLDADAFAAFVLFMLILGEAIYTFLVCLYGERLSTESGKVFYSLSDTPVWNLDSRNRYVIRFMLMNSMNPIVVRTPGVCAANLKSFGDILTTAYQVISVASKMKN